MKNFIVLPCYNEEKNIIGVLKDINSLKLEKNIIVVDDGSLDNSYLKIKNNFKNVLLLKHKINLGKGAALKTGCKAAIKLGADVIVLIDSDGQHLPIDILRIIEKVSKENFDIVFGARKMDIKKMPAVFYFGNKFLTKIINFVSGASTSDSQCGFKAFKSYVYEKISWQSTDYSVETEMIFNAHKNHLKCGEIFIDTIYNDKYKGTTPFDGIKILLNIIKKKFL